MSINNKNVKQLLENDYLLIHCLTRWIGNRRRPLLEKKKDSHQILIKMNQATHLPIWIVSHMKNYENDNNFFEIFGKIWTHVEFFKNCKNNARYPSALVQ